MYAVTTWDDRGKEIATISVAPRREYIRIYVDNTFETVGITLTKEEASVFLEVLQKAINDVT
jgi:hypothetical protein